MEVYGVPNESLFLHYRHSSLPAVVRSEEQPKRCIKLKASEIQSCSSVPSEDPAPAYLGRTPRDHRRRNCGGGVSPANHLIFGKHSNEVQRAGIQTLYLVLAAIDFQLHHNKQQHKEKLLLKLVESIDQSGSPSLTRRSRGEANAVFQGT